MLNPDSPHYQAEVWIDPENKYEDVDNLSMINLLVQLENVASYSFMKPGLSTAQHLLHSMWFDIKENRVMVFSR